MFHLYLKAMRIYFFLLVKFSETAWGLFKVEWAIFMMMKKSLQEVKQELRPFDILFEKTPFRLTDKFIPGHFGHVAIYIGQ